LIERCAILSAIIGADMAKLGVFIVFATLSVAGSALAEKAHVSPSCPKQPGMIGDAIVATADTARSIYLSVAKQRGDKVSPGNDVVVDDDGERWVVYQHPKDSPATNHIATGEEVTTIIQGGGTLDMEIDKCTGAIRAHYSR
jgi:hypothetical protein